MRKIKYVLFLLSIVHSYCLGENTKEYQIILNRTDFSIKVDEEMAYITTDKYLCEYGGETSKPALPYIGINILIGRNESFSSFTYTVEEQLLLDNISIVNNSK